MVANGKLYTYVMEKLRFEPNIDESRITIAIKGDDIVILGGKVVSYSEKRLAEESVKKIEKVKGVANEIEVDMTASYKRDDADIVKAALESLKWIFLIPSEKIKVTVKDGHLELTGEVEYNYQKERAEQAVEDLYGVTFVTNNIKIKSSINPIEVKEKITPFQIANATL